MVSTDVYRPAAREQLAQVAKATGTPLWPGTGTDKPLEIVRGAMREAKLSACDVILVDTAGRLHIDDELMNELSTLKRELNPSEMLFVADAMIGQDAVRSAGEFHKRLGVTGVVLTKMDGDARGGAALSIRKVTGAPVKFVGVGEKYDALEPFHPDRIVSRILGMGDVLGLIERAEKTIDEKKARELERKMREDDFTLEDFRDQLKQIRKMGSLEQLMGMLPKIGPFAKLPKDAEIDEGRLKSIEAIINSMTASRARQQQLDRRQAPQTHRARQRHQRAASERSAEAVRGHASHDEAVRQHGENEDARHRQTWGLELKMRNLWALGLATAFVGCDGNSAPNRTAMDNAPVLKIAVFPDGRLTVDGVPSSIQSLRDSLHKVSEQHGVVWYYRESGQEEAPPVATDVIKEVIAARVPIRLSTKPDYSDSVVPPR